MTRRDQEDLVEHVQVEPNRRIRFDGTINAGNLLTIIAFVGTLAAGWSALDKRVAILEQKGAEQAARDQQQDTYMRERLDMVLKSQESLQRSIERLADKLERR